MSRGSGWKSGEVDEDGKASSGEEKGGWERYRNDSFSTQRRYFISLICSKVGFAPPKASTSARSFAHTSGRFEISHQTFERSEAVVSRPARRMLSSSLRICTLLSVCLTSSWRKT